MDRLIQALQQSKEDTRQQMLILIMVLDITEETVSQLVKMVCSLVEVDPELAVEMLLLVLTLVEEERVDIQMEQSQSSLLNKVEILQVLLLHK